MNENNATITIDFDYCSTSNGIESFDILFHLYTHTKRSIYLDKCHY